VLCVDHETQSAGFRDRNGEPGGHAAL